MPSPTADQTALFFTLDLMNSSQMLEAVSRGLNPQNLSKKGWGALWAATKERLASDLAEPEHWPKLTGRLSYEAPWRADLVLTQIWREALQQKGARGKEAARRFALSFGSPELLAEAKARLDSRHGHRGGAAVSLGWLASAFLGDEELEPIEDPKTLSGWSQLALERGLWEALKEGCADVLAQDLLSCERLGLARVACDEKTANLALKTAKKMLPGRSDQKAVAVAEQIVLFAASPSSGKAANESESSGKASKPAAKTRRI